MTAQIASWGAAGPRSVPAQYRPATPVRGAKGVVTRLTLHAAHLPRPGAQDAAFTEALHLLTTWAVRAARQAQGTSANDPASLDFVGPPSDESPRLRDHPGSLTTPGGSQ